jgi:integrase
MICYSAGLRISEALNLKPTDIDSKRRMIQIRGGKGKKDRITLLSVRLLEILREYYRLYKPQEYLFTKNHSDLHPFNRQRIRPDQEPAG